MSIGQKTGILWLVWLGLAAAYCVVNLVALSSVTTQTDEIYRSQLKPAEDLSEAASSLTALQAVLENPSLINSSHTLTHGYIPLLQGEVDASMGRYFTAYEASLKQMARTLRTPAVRETGLRLIQEEATNLDAWENAWGDAQSLIATATQPNPPASLRLDIETKFQTAGEALKQIQTINAELGAAEAEDAREVARLSRLAALVLSILAISGVGGLALLQRRLIIQPLKLLTRAADSARQGDLTPRVAVGSRDEIGRLSHTFNSMMSALQDAHERLTGQNLALQDHARALEALAEAEAAQRIAETEASRLKSQFLANMSHELRTPMNSVIGYSQVLLEEMDGPLEPDQKQDVERILSAGHHLLGLINDILDLSKIESGKMTFDLEPFSIASAVETAFSTVQTLADQKGLTLASSIPADIPQVYADPAKVRQVLLNLLSNAIKFTSSGSVDVTAHASDDTVVIEVKDSGIGIPEAAQGYIFEEFRQVDGSTARKYGGTGLGLAISRKLIRLQGGDITVSSRQNAGSVFRVSLPVEAPARHAEGADPTQPYTALYGHPDRPRILCIDDDPASLNLLVRHLTAGGYQVSTASSADEGLALAREIKPDLLTMDIMMPEKDGWQALEELKADPLLNSIPVLIVSIIDNRQLALALGAIDSVPKPIDRASLLTALERAKDEGRSAEILVVDDDVEACKFVTRTLEEANYKARFALTGEQALKSIAENPPDVVVLDLKMPSLDGFEVIRRLQQHEKPPPVVVLTALDLTPMQRENIAGDIVDVVDKGPYNRAHLLHAVSRAVETGQVRAAGADHE